MKQKYMMHAISLSFSAARHGLSKAFNRTNVIQ